MANHPPHTCARVCNGVERRVAAAKRCRCAPQHIDVPCTQKCVQGASTAERRDAVSRAPRGNGIACVQWRQNAVAAFRRTSTWRAREKCVQGASVAKTLLAVGIQCQRRQRRMARAVRRMVTEWSAGSSGEPPSSRSTAHRRALYAENACRTRLRQKRRAAVWHTMLAAATAHTTVKKRGAGSRGQRVLLPRAAFGEIGVLSHGCSAGSRSSGFLPRATSRKVECAVSPFLSCGRGTTA